MILNVAYSTDNNYVQHVGVSLISLFENNKEFDEITVYIIENNISEISKVNIKLISEKYNRQIKFIDFNKFKGNLKLDIKNSISLSSYARLFLGRIISTNVERVIYMDCDSVINKSLMDLWTMNIYQYYIAGVLDTVSNETKVKVGMDLKSPYVNAGMLLINLKKWREDNIEEKFIEFIDTYNGKVFHHDQGTINGVLNKKILILHPKYNAMTTFFTMNRTDIITYYGLSDYYDEVHLKEAIEEPIFVHYTPAFTTRPWIKGCKHPLRGLYEKYLDMTPWKNIKLRSDSRKAVEKFVASLYNNLPFNVANRICKSLYR
ncbi:glycosyltransferase family 8 protein [Clostridium grantii]|uniref:Lipopolysaccharide biosynthesis protein, LPS:glycosyltransferase n=1 Tax=Clostridium grantii DSM 8605 TaxID=1121316 RepID=A0A1M5UZ67_9CLOT|nr:glycosyltransferase family 8 protein [Clostridium grantii]SHH68281.1 Lipopolysaccharide biosynthesis protein, LPS:glycosyltransferase [Clostridium grantii DSM 8605]